MSPSPFVSTIVGIAWLVFSALVARQRRYSPIRTVYGTLGGALVILVVALAPASPGYYAVKVLIAALAGALMEKAVRGEGHNRGRHLRDFRRSRSIQGDRSR
ncbi:MAG: hypothetical protein M3066_12705 [Actinomycetota bacterium]|nr:hypothetical protein [Actinomycetota bacterium]